MKMAPTIVLAHSRNGVIEASATHLRIDEAVSRMRFFPLVIGAET